MGTVGKPFCISSVHSDSRYFFLFFFFLNSSDDLHLYIYICYIVYDKNKKNTKKKLKRRIENGTLGLPPPEPLGPGGKIYTTSCWGAMPLPLCRDVHPEMWKSLTSSFGTDLRLDLQQWW